MTRRVVFLDIDGVLTNGRVELDAQGQERKALAFRDLDALGFHTVGYGCTTCIGNSGPLHEAIEQAIEDGDLTVASVLSGNRNFEGRIHPLVKTNWLASPPLVVAYALAGNVRLDLTRDPLGVDRHGQPVYLKDIWPSQAEIAEAVEKVRTEMFRKEYAEVFDGDATWRALEVPESQVYAWSTDSTYIQHPPFFEGMGRTPEAIEDVREARILAMLGDSVTTDHISPAGSIKPDSPAGRYLQERGIKPVDFNSYGSRRGNHEVMMRGTFANVRIRNEMLDGVVGGETRHVPSGEQMAIYDAAMRYKTEKVPLVTSVIDTVRRHPALGVEHLARFELPWDVGLEANAGVTAIGQQRPEGQLIQALVAGLVAYQSPKDLSLMFIDFKGGSASEMFKDLPHISGRVTDLDGGPIRFNNESPSLSGLVASNGRLHGRILEEIGREQARLLELEAEQRCTQARIDGLRAKLVPPQCPTAVVVPQVAARLPGPANSAEKIRRDTRRHATRFRRQLEAASVLDLPRSLQRSGLDALRVGVHFDGIRHTVDEPPQQLTPEVLVGHVLEADRVVHLPLPRVLRHERNRLATAVIVERQNRPGGATRLVRAVQQLGGAGLERQRLVDSTNWRQLRPPRG